MDNFDKMKIEKYKNTLVFDMFDIVELIDITEDEHDYYYKYRNKDGEEYESSAVVWFIPLKWNIISEEYDNYFNYFKNQPFHSNSKEFLKTTNNNTRVVLLWNEDKYWLYLLTTSSLWLVIEDLNGKRNNIEENDIIIELYNKIDQTDYDRLFSWWKMNSSAKEFVLLRNEPIINKINNNTIELEWKLIEKDVLEQLIEYLDDIYYNFQEENSKNNNEEEKRLYIIKDNFTLKRTKEETLFKEWYSDKKKNIYIKSRRKD